MGIRANAHRQTLLKESFGARPSGRSYAGGPSDADTLALLSPDTGTNRLAFAAAREEAARLQLLDLGSSGGALTDTRHLGLHELEANERDLMSKYKWRRGLPLVRSAIRC